MPLLLPCSVLEIGRKGSKFLDSLTFSFADLHTHCLADVLIHLLLLLPLTHPSSHWLILFFQQALHLPHPSQAWCCVLDKELDFDPRQRGAMMVLNSGGAHSKVCL